MPDNELIDRYFAAMRRGAGAEEEMMALFADDAPEMALMQLAWLPEVNPVAARVLAQAWAPQVELEYYRTAEPELMEVL